MGVLDDAIREHLELKRQHGVSEEELRRQEEEALGPARREVVPAESADDEAVAEPELHEEETVLQEPSAKSPTEDAHADDPGPGFFDGVADVAPIEGEVGEQMVAERAAEADVGEARAAEERVPEAEIAEPEIAEQHVGEREIAQEGVAEPEIPEPERVEPELAEPPAADADLAEGRVPDEPPTGEEILDETPSEPPGDTLPSGFERLDDDEALEDDEPLDDDVLLDEEGEPQEGDADVLEDTPDFLQETPEHDRLWFEQKPPRDFDFD